MTTDNVIPIESTVATRDAAAAMGSDSLAVLLGFLTFTEPLDGCSFEEDDDFHHGNQLLLAWALAKSQEGPTPEWDTDDCADVVRFVHSIQPTQGHCFCNDRSGEMPNLTCGFHEILEHVERSLRRLSGHPDETREATP